MVEENLKYRCCRYSLQTAPEKTLLGLFEFDPANAGQYSVEPLHLVTDLDHVPLKRSAESNLALQDMPQLVLDGRSPLVLQQGEINFAADIYVVHEIWAVQGYIVYREGMEDIYCIGHEFADSGGARGSAPTSYLALGQHRFPYAGKLMPSAANERVLANMLRSSYVDTMHNSYKFRNRLAEAFGRGLLKCKGVKPKLTFEFAVDSSTVLTLFLWPPVSDGVVQRSRTSKNSALVLREAAVRRYTTPSDGMTLSVNNPRVLDGLLGECQLNEFLPCVLLPLYSSVGREGREH
jgi:hypothetical protein